MAQKGFTHIDLFNDNSGGWVLSNATISGGILNITVTGGYGQRSPDANWLSGANNDFIIEVDFKQDAININAMQIHINLIGDAVSSILFYIFGSDNTMRIWYDGVNKASQAYVDDTNWHTSKIRRVGTTYYWSIDGGAEISWNYGTARAINHIKLYMSACTGDFDNFKYSWIKAVLEGAISFSGDVSRKLSLKRTFEGSVSFIGTLQRKLSLKRLFEGNVSFIGTLKIRRLWNAISKRSNVWTPQDKRDNDWTKE